ELLVTGADAVHVHEAERAREAAREPHDDVEPATEGSEIDHGALDGGQREERRALADPETRRHRSHRFTLTQSPGVPAMARVLSGTRGSPPPVRRRRSRGS